MKYSELLEALKSMNEDQLNAEVMVFENGEQYMECRLVADDVYLNIAPMGAMANGGQVTDDYYGIADDNEDGMMNVKKLLDCRQPYLMIGVGSIPTCKEAC